MSYLTNGDPQGQPATPPPADQLQLLVNMLQEMNTKLSGLECEMSVHTKAIANLQAVHPPDVDEQSQDEMSTTPQSRRSCRMRAFCASRSASPSNRLCAQDSRAITDVVKNLESCDGTTGSPAKHWLHHLHEAVRCLSILQLSPTDQVESFFLSQISMKFRSSAQTWFLQFKSSRPTCTYHDLEAAFKQHFISPHEVALAARTKFWSLHEKARH
jgi:hypothetical protein